MARLNTQPASSDDESDQERSSQHLTRRITSDTSRSPAASFSSDKENRDHASRPTSRGEKRRTHTANMPTSSTSASAGLSKRRRPDERSETVRSQTAHTFEYEERIDKQYYDPDQNAEERRATRRKIRDLAKELNGGSRCLTLLSKRMLTIVLDSRGEYLQPNSKGLVDTLKKADTYFRDVKETSTATIDSRLLVAAGDLSYKKTNELALGDHSSGVDVDEFVSKCISFMKRGTRNVDRGDRSSSAGPSRTLTQSRRRRHVVDEEDEEGDVLDWDLLGRNACFLYNSRPCLSGFLLGPLSVQKRVRQQTQRRAREARANPANATRPQELNAEDMEKQESANLTVVCREIRSLLGRIQEKGEAATMAELGDNMTQQAEQVLLRKHGVADDGNVPFFDFCVNPKSFGQTVENMFYVSFLIKEGSVGLNFDSRGMPTLGIAHQKSVEQRQETPKNQAVFALDFDMWEAIVDSHAIQRSLIPHRPDEQYDDGTNGDGESGWYD